ncbi:potassium-transporting ATPase subunit KdpC [Sphingobium sp. CR2-8]|uniref:potassium-transporting ATPase subunit KdpC n=1 Tax=Sphingobium sp. CR2-8 TaxID=1306534 RepID=UPI002DBC69C7|nr:potassium-transporting ATPase subunit KdpC [Sphingobium sp. CR2-8]MEC3912441.1 potassium-transporting ATPase subunit KdpC [Sphingobium sp. CR2-8]
MNKDILSSLRPALVMTILFAMLLGLAYPLALTGIGQLVFPAQANGSLIVADGKVVGSALIGQGFASDRYFHPRPSAAGKGYDGLASSGSNLGPASQALVDRVKGDIQTYKPATPDRPVPSDLVTASASGLDPHITPEAAFYQVARVAAARGLAAPAIHALVERSVERPLLGILGEPRVNVLEINRRLDEIGATKS